MKKSFLILLIAELVFTASGYVIHASLGRFLGVADYGRYSLVIGFTTMVIILVGRGIPTAMAKRMSENLNAPAMIAAIKRTAIRLQFATITLLTLIFYFCAPLLAQLFNDPTLTPLFQLAAFIIPAFALSSFHALSFNGRKQFGAMSIMKLSRGLFRILWIIGLAVLFGLQGALLGAIFAPLSVFGVALIIDLVLLRKVASTASKPAEAYPATKLLSYAGRFMLFLIFYELFVRIDLFLIKSLLQDDTATGLYTAAMTLALIPYYLLFALTFVLFPTISDLVAQGNHAKIKALLTQVLRFLLMALLPSAILIGLYAEQLAVFFFGADFAPAAVPLTFLLGGTIFGTFFYVLASVFNGASMTRVPTITTGIALAASIVLNVLFLPRYGITAAAMIFSGTSLFMGLSTLWYTRAYFAASIPWQTILKVLVASVVMLLIAPWLLATGWWFILSGAILCGAYGITLFLLKELSWNEIKDLIAAKKV